MNSSIEREIDRYHQQILKLQEAWCQLNELVKRFPDLEIYHGGHGNKYYVSKSVNQLVIDFERKFVCGCCQDSPLEVWPFLDTPNGRVYSNPASFVIGSRDEIGLSALVSPVPGWEQQMEQAGIPAVVIKRAKLLLPE